MNQQAGTAIGWASRLIVAGVNVIPIRPRDKRPAVATWKPYQDAPMIESFSADQLDRYVLSWWGGKRPHGLAALTGAYADLVVVDVDSPAAREAVVAMCGEWPRTTEVSTAKGSHLWFAHPGNRVPNRVRVADVPLDVRADGGYVLVPPSIHPSGVRYRWERWLWPPPQMPEALRELLWKKPIPLDQQNTRSVVHSANGYANAALEREAAAVVDAAVGMRNDTLNRAAFALARFCASGDLTAAVIADVLLAAATVAGLPTYEARATIASGFSARGAA